MGLRHLRNEPKTNMMSNRIHESLQHLAHPIDELELLENNPRKGDVDAIGASYERFEQVKPIVAVEKDGVTTVIAGNHQLRAARALGWDKIAVLIFKGTDKEAIAFALSDNRLSELGTIDTDLVFQNLAEVIDGNEEYFDALGWDDFEMAAMEPTVIDETESVIGWEPPALINVTEEDDEELHFDGTKEEEEAIVKQGATSAGVSGKPNAVVQYTLVFDNATQQAVWYEFIRWMKAEQDQYPGHTTTEQLIEFLEQSDFREFDIHD